MDAALAQMQALPTVLAPIVKHPQGRTEVKSPAATPRPASFSATSCSKAWRPMAACTCPSLPAVDAATLAAAGARSTTPAGTPLAFEILSLYIDDIPADDLRAPVQKTYTAEVPLARDEIVPLKPAGRRLVPGSPVQRPHAGLQGHGDAAAGQPVRVRTGPPRRAAQHPGRHQRRHRQRGRIRHARQEGRARLHDSAPRPHEPLPAGADVQPAGRQHPQHRVEGVFDDCQDIVKAVSNDLDFKRRYKIGTVNSINWARLLAQVVYYFAGYFQATQSNAQKVSFTVPSGNFGNVCAGHVARMMGLPIERLVVATNENDVLDEFFRTGTYRVRGSAETFETSSPSMDISKASNFERFVFDLLGRDGQRTQGLVRRAGDPKEGGFTLSAEPEFARRWPPTASSAARAPTPTAWPRSATPGSQPRAC
jgi:threonine synthase